MLIPIEFILLPLVCIWIELQTDLGYANDKALYLNEPLLQILQDSFEGKPQLLNRMVHT